MNAMMAYWLVGNRRGLLSARRCSPHDESMSLLTSRCSASPRAKMFDLVPHTRVRALEPTLQRADGECERA